MSTEYAERVLTLFRKYEPEDDISIGMIRGLMIGAMDRALREATPAGEVTADAVVIACKAYDQYDTKEIDGVAHYPSMQAALAVAFPALVQQVERLTDEVEDLEKEVTRVIAERETLSAENARLAKDAERYSTLRSSQVKQSQYSNFFQSVNDDCNPPYLELKHGADLDAAVDAATAQAKQAEDEK